MSNIITRFADIMSANINAILSKAEAANADKLLEKYIADAKRDLNELKAETAGVIAEEMAVGRKLNDCEEDILKYTKYAEAAVRAGNDGDARKFLQYKQQAAARLGDLQTSYRLAKENSEKMRLMSQKLMQDISEAEGKMIELKNKMTIAREQEKIQKLNSRLGSAGSSLDNIDGLFDAVQKRIDSIDARTALEADLDPDRERRELEEKYSSPSALADNSVEDELARLKASLQ